MTVDDSTYITPHEAALAVVATAMKKARMQLDVLILNTVMAGILFSCGSILTVAVHSENPDTWNRNPGTFDFLSGIFYGTGLFYVVVLGADLYNSNILYFSVGLLRRSVTIYDLLISWFCSIIGNMSGCLLVSYVICHLSAASTSELWKVGSRKLVEGKAAFSFIQTMLKGIGGNFFVCLAIYLQLMAKPLHVRWILTVLPIFTFTACGFTHVVADMTLSFIGMLNGADVSVGKYIWKLLIPAAVGNILGGFFFSFTIPFCLHLLAVDRDKKRLNLPQYDERDEQPELNMDSRVVKVRPDGEKYDEEQAEEAEDLHEKSDLKERPGHNSDDSYSSSSETRSRSSSGASSYSDRPQAFDGASLNSRLTRTSTNRSNWSYYSTKSGRPVCRVRRTPAGVFPVKGMGSPLSKESESHALGRVASMPAAQRRSNKSSFMKIPHDEDDADSNYNVLDQRPGAKLEKAITRLVTRVPSSQTISALPRTTQEAFPYYEQASTYGSRKASLDRLAGRDVTATHAGKISTSKIPKAKILSPQKGFDSLRQSRSIQSLPKTLYHGVSNNADTGGEDGSSGMSPREQI